MWFCQLLFLSPKLYCPLSWPSCRWWCLSPGWSLKWSSEPGAEGVGNITTGCVLYRTVNSDVFPCGIYLTSPGLFSVLHWKLRSYTTLIWATFCSGTPFSLNLLSPVQAALRGDYYHSHKEHVGCSPWRRPERPDRNVGQTNLLESESPPTLTLDPIPMHLTKWDCKWEQCVCYPLTSVRVTVQHQQQSEVCTIHTRVSCFYLGYTAK